MNKVLLLSVSIALCMSAKGQTGSISVGDVENSVQNVKSLMKNFKKNKSEEPVIAKNESNGEFASRTIPATKVHQIPSRVIFDYFINSNHTNLKTLKHGNLDIEKADQLVENFITYFKDMNLEKYDEFDKRKLIAQYKDTLKKTLNAVDFNNVYTSQIKVQNVGTYDFENKRLPCNLNYDFSQGFANNAAYENQPEHSTSEKLNGLRVLYTNVQPGLEGIYLYLDESNAEKVVKTLNSGGAYGIAIVKHMKFLPIAFLSQTYDYQSAQLLKLEFYYLHKGENGKRYLGDKISEMDWPAKQYSHTNLY